MRSKVTKSGFFRSEAGTVAILWALSLVVFFGLIALIFDIGRASITQSELQTYADHVALAAAGELNGASDAIERAKLAARTQLSGGLIADTQHFGAGGADLSVDVENDLRFLTKIPDDDKDPLSQFTTDPAEARYVEVTISPRSVTLPFFRAVRGLLGQGTGAVSANVGAVAVAGSESQICDITPLFFCKPVGRDLTDENEIGTMIKLRTGQSGSLWGPGNFGFIDPDQALDEDGVCEDETGRAGITNCLVGAEITKTMCVTNKLDLSPGQQVGITNAAFNYRFDMFNKNDPERIDPRFPPAPNVVSGLVPELDGCYKNSQTPSTDTTYLTREPSLDCETCTDRFSSPGGNWETLKPDYMTKNHPDQGAGFQDIGEGDFNFPDGFDVSKVKGTRFETYLQEIKFAANNGGRILGETLEDGSSSFPETGLPQCHQQASADPFRRVVTAAMVDCSDPTIEVKGNNKDVPAAGFVQVFLTEPVGLQTYPGGNFDIWGEVIGTAGTGGQGAEAAGGIARIVIRLVR